ncbi:AraC family transcriptional regulator [Bradyrhizobium sp. SYSU BS000235]|uniref:AraC family transcriptional regulator n=1 Tax=Bradyrhizobium sp. SYSU BS000235 TaxID=3411332 RepID=UPI003C76C730
MLVNPDFLRDRTGMNLTPASDPMSEILDLLGARCLMSGGLMAGGAWSLRFRAPEVIKVMAVAEGSCLMLFEDRPPTHLHAGDVIIVDGKRPFVVATDPSLKPEEATTIFADSIKGIARIGAPHDTVILGGHVALDPLRQALLLDVLPPMVHVRHTSNEAAVLQWLVKQLVREMSEDHPGGLLVTTQLAQLMFVQALRAHLETAGPVTGGWLKGLADERIAVALRLMHGEPSRAWTLEELAKAAGMSRTTFALRFKTLVGTAPLAYLLAWRMHLAERDLRDGEKPVSAIAFALGYTSESAFSNAFKRAKGFAPKRYRTTSRASASLASTTSAALPVSDAL